MDDDDDDVKKFSNDLVGLCKADDFVFQMFYCIIHQEHLVSKKLGAHQET